MRNTESPEVLTYVKAQNDYAQARTASMAGLRQTLFDELRSRIRQTDMSVPTRVHGYWYFTRTIEGEQYGVPCRIRVTDPDDWQAPNIDEQATPGSAHGEEVVFDTNAEARGKDFFRLGGMDVSVDGRWLLYGVDVHGNERYDFHIRDLWSGQDADEVLQGISSACFTPDAQWVFYVTLDEAWRPCAVFRHRVGTEVSNDVEVFREQDERFWVGLGLSFDETRMVISTASKTSCELLLLPVSDPEGPFRVFIARQADVEYDAGFSRLEHAGPHGEDVAIAVVCHNVNDPNFEIDIIDVNSHEPPFALGEGVPIAFGSPYGCERGDHMEAAASHKPVDTPYRNTLNPALLQDARGLEIEGLSVHRAYITLSYRADGAPHLAVITKSDAIEDYRQGRPWRFHEILPSSSPSSSSSSSGAHDAHLYSIGSGGNPSYDAPRLRYSFVSYTRPAELHELNPATGEDVLLKRAQVLGDFDADRYSEHRLWIKARDGEHIPVSLVWRHDPLQDAGKADGAGETDSAGKPVKVKRPMFITGYGAYEISSDPSFSVARLSMLDRGVLYAVVHTRGGGEMGRAWYEQGRMLHKKHTFEDFVDATRTLQQQGYADVNRTVANGGSAGGLLMGAVANMAPECFAGIEADVPFVDALTSILDPSLPLTVTEWDEWGDPLHNADVYEYMKSYSPYENSPSAQHPASRFPSILITSSMHDTRVLVVEPLKWLARLQSAGVDAIAKIAVEAGHGGISGRYEQWRDVAYENAWCLNVMGLRQ